MAFAMNMPWSFALAMPVASLSYVEIKVFGPESSLDLEFQNGRTDGRGAFAFVPDRPGFWRAREAVNVR